MAQDLRAFMVSQAATIEAAVYEAKYASIQYPMLAAVSTEGAEWAPSIERRISDGAGTAAEIGQLSQDWPSVDVHYTRAMSEVHAFGTSYSVTEEEAWTAQQGGFMISADKARTARRIVEERLDNVFFTGGDNATVRKWDQFASPTGAGSTAVTNKWGASGTTTTQMAKAVNDAISAVYVATKQIHLPNTLALPTAAFTAMASLQVPNTTMTAAEWIRRNNSYTAATGNDLRILAVHQLDTGKNALVYENDADVVRFHLPMPATVKGPQLSTFGMTMTYGIMARTGGLEWRIPTAAHRLTGIIA